MAAQRKPTNGALVAAGIGLGVALVAGAITLVASSKGNIAEEFEEFFGGKRKPTGSAPAPRPPVAAARPPTAADHKARRQKWMADTRSSDSNLSECALTSRYLALKARIAGGEVDERFNKAMRDVGRDIDRTTVPHPTMPVEQVRVQLRNVLAAIALDDPDIGYVQGMNFIVAFLIVTMRAAQTEDSTPSSREAAEADVFTLFTRLLRSPAFAMRALYTPGLPGLHVLNDAMGQAIAHGAPTTQALFDQVGVTPMHLHEWWFCLFTYMLPWDEAVGVWDAFLSEGWVVPARVTVSLLDALQPLLSGTGDMMEVISVLKGFSAHASLRGQPPSSSLFTLAPPANIAATAAAAHGDITPAMWRGWYHTAQARFTLAQVPPAAAGGASSPPPAADAAEDGAGGALEETGDPAPALSPPAGGTTTPAGGGLGESWLVVDEEDTVV